MKRRLLFLDLDGTLLNDAKQITPGNRQALERALEWGHGIIITTGRPLKSAMEQARNLGLDQPGCYFIAYNGALIYDWAKNEQIYKRTLPTDVVVRLFSQAEKMGVHIQTYDTWDVLVEPRCDDTEVRRYCQLIRMDFRVIEDVRKDLPEEPVKCLAIHYDRKDGLLAFQAWIREHMAQQVDCFFSCDQYMEIVPKGMSKGDAVQRLCRMLQVDIADAVSVGDAANDLSMIRAAGIGVAMANATQEVKAAAQYITKNDNNHDGVAEVVAQYFWEAAQSRKEMDHHVM